MPICTTCTHYVPYLYTVYESANNLRLEQCESCQAFADPYVEHDTLTLVLDLILLKRDVYRHLLFNRGAPPRKAEHSKTEGKEKGKEKGEEEGPLETVTNTREKERWILVLRLGAALVALDSFIRWSYLNGDHPTGPWTTQTAEQMLRVLLGCFVETIFFHLGIMSACYFALQLVTWLRGLQLRGQSAPVSDIQKEFRREFYVLISSSGSSVHPRRFSLIPLTLFYSSLTKLFLLFLLTIWPPMSAPSIDVSVNDDTWYRSSFISKAFEAILDDDQLDREWIIRNVLGGMSAGFGLRVILDIHPIFTSLIILSGWKLKTAVAGIISTWVGGNELATEAWRAYSIP